MSKMLFSYAKIFVSGKENGWRNRVSFCFLCLLLGITINVCLNLVLVLSKVEIGLVNLGITFSLGILIFFLACIFKSVRCMSILFLLACGMREGRNVLITVGTSIVIFNNVKNILGNLKIVADSIICNLEAKRVSLKVMPFDFYSNLIYSIYIYAKQQFFNPFAEVVSLSDDFQFKIRISDHELKALLNETKAHIQSVSSNLSSAFDILTSVGRIAFLIGGISIILVGIWIFFTKFLSHNKANNSYITKEFLQYDAKQPNALRVLPLSRKEQNKYIQIPSLRTSEKQKLNGALYFLPVMTNILIWTLISFLDFMLYWLILTVNEHLQSLGPVVVPITMTFSHHLVDLDVLFNSRRTQTQHPNIMIINLFEPQCVPKPELSLSASWIPLTILISVLVFFGSISTFLVQMKLLVMASFYPSKELERVHYLHQKILAERSQATLAGKLSRKLRNILSQERYIVVEFKNIFHYYILG
ncbi:PREDICTED: dendritic cell-specific transmembrane protein [Nanorana parkeri]|uniref:dendritic cell-specific transmembrane protein n=1 Tax=Nanorana parkeri TaxID=125878 RepID=UPI000854DDF6|nr:PREDICTED: dendritic cell-specific transmembrane protein [Nanorana parkeri]